MVGNEDKGIFLFCQPYFRIFASVRVTRTSKTMQSIAIRTVVYSLSENKVILLTLFISKRYIPRTDLRKICGKASAFQQFNERRDENKKLFEFIVR